MAVAAELPHGVSLLFDQDTQRLVGIFQKVFHLSYVERDQVKYVKPYARHIEWAGRLFEYLGLAKPESKAPSVGDQRLFCWVLSASGRRVSQAQPQTGSHAEQAHREFAARCGNRRREL